MIRQREKHWTAVVIYSNIGVAPSVILLAGSALALPTAISKRGS